MHANYCCRLNFWNEQDIKLTETDLLHVGVYDEGERLLQISESMRQKGEKDNCNNVGWSNQRAEGALRWGEIEIDPEGQISEDFIKE